MNSIDDVRQSFGRCMLAGDLFGRFYEIFLASHPDIPSRFVNTNFAKQKQLLHHSIVAALLFANDRPFGTIILERIRQSHSRAALNISPGLYTYWKRSFLQALAELDPEFSSALQARWDEALQKTIDYVVKGYDGASPSI